MADKPRKFRVDGKPESWARGLKQFVDRVVDFIESLPSFALITVTLTDSADVGKEILAGFRPKAVIVGRATRTDGTASASAIQVDWVATELGFEIVDFRGMASSQPHDITFLVVG